MSASEVANSAPDPWAWAGDLAPEAVQTILEAVGKPLAPLRQADLIEWRTGVPAPDAAVNRAIMMLSRLHSRAIGIGLCEGFRFMTVVENKQAHAALSHLKKGRNGLEHVSATLPWKREAALGEALAKLKDAIDEAERALQDEDRDRRSRELEILLRDYAQAILRNQPDEAAKLRVDLENHPHRLTDARIAYALDRSRGREFLKYMAATAHGVRRDGSDLEVFVREEIAPIYEVLFGLSAGASYSDTTKRHGGPFVRFACAFLATVGLETSPGTIRNAIHRMR